MAVHSTGFRERQKRPSSKIISVRSVTPTNLLCEIHLDSPVLAQEQQGTKQSEVGTNSASHNYEVRISQGLEPALDS